MATLREAVGDSARNFVCAAAAFPDPFRNYVRSATSSVPGIGDLAGFGDDLADAAAAVACSDSNNGTLPGSTVNVDYGSAAGFTGGQCVGDQYRVIATYDRFVNGSFSATQVDTVGGQLYTGPIEEVFLTSGNQDVRVRHNNGQISDHESGDPSSITYNNIRDVRVENTTDASDPCGNGANLPSTGLPVGDGTIIYDPGDGIDVNAPITFNPTFPIVLPGGQLVMPIEICLLAFCLDVFLNLSTGDISLSFGDNPVTDDCCPEPDDIPGDDESESDPPEPDSDVRLWGVKTVCAVNENILGATQVSDGDGPTLFIPRLGVVRFAVELGGGRGWTADQPIKSLSQLTPVNVPATAYAYKIIAEKGVTVTAFPVIVNSEE